MSGDAGWGADIIFRELIQHEDGFLGTKFPAEMIPKSGDPLNTTFEALTEGVTGNGKTISVKALKGFEIAMLTGIPRNVRITLQVKPEPNSSYFGIA